jgi:hypothetical protein
MTMLRRFSMVLDRQATDGQLTDLTDRVGLPTWSNAPGAREIVLIRRATTLTEAIVAGVRDVEAVGLRPLRVGNGDPVTLGAIADRIRRSRESVRLWALGTYGPGGFPPPVCTSGGTTFFSWAEVSPWLRRYLGCELPEEDPARVALDLVLRLRALAPRVARMDLIRRLLDD